VAIMKRIRPKLKGHLPLPIAVAWCDENGAKLLAVRRFTSLAIVLFSFISAAYANAAPTGEPRPLPPQVISNAPGMQPLGKGRHSWWGIKMYDATLWIVGPRWSSAAPHALDLEPSRAVPADLLVKNALAEMRELKVGDDQQYKLWHAELAKVIPSVSQGDQIVIFCSDTNRTIVYLNNSTTGEVDDPSFCPAVMSVWLHPQTKHQTMRKSLLKH
jgi:hypothetical protein